MKSDIQNRADIRQLVNAFYKKLLKDEAFNHIFLEIAQIDVLAHLDIIVDFWESVLFGTGKYKGNPVLKHVELDQKSQLHKEHFEQWQQLFFEKRYSAVELENPDFIKIAEGFGVQGKTISDASEIDAGIAEMLSHDGPYLLHVMVEKEENIFPMIATGKAVDEIVLE